MFAVLRGATIGRGHNLAVVFATGVCPFRVMKHFARGGPTGGRSGCRRVATLGPVATGTFTRRSRGASAWPTRLSTNWPPRYRAACIREDPGPVADLLERWMLHRETQDRAPSTLVRYRSANDVRIVPALGSIELTKLTAADLDAFSGALPKQGLHLLSVGKRHVGLPPPGGEWGLIDRNPIVRSSPPPARQREVVPPTAGEVRRLIVECERVNPDCARLFSVAATTGCRRGELCGLQWGDIDFDNATMVVARSTSDTLGNVAVKGTKTYAARRLALVSGHETFDALVAHAEVGLLDLGRSRPTSFSPARRRSTPTSRRRQPDRAALVANPWAFMAETCG